MQWLYTKAVRPGDRWQACLLKSPGGAHTHLLYLPCVQSATGQKAPLRHPDHHSVGLGAGWPQPGPPRWGRCPARCGKNETTWAPSPAMLWSRPTPSGPGLALTASREARPLHPPVLPSASTWISGTRGRVGWLSSPGALLPGCQPSTS